MRAVVRFRRGARLQRVAHLAESRAKLARLGEVREELFTNLRRDEVVLGEEPLVLVPLTVRRVELQKPADEADVIWEALVREGVEAEVEIRLRASGVGSRGEEFFEVAFSLAVVETAYEFAREVFKLFFALAPQEPAREAVAPSLSGEIVERLFVDARLLVEQVCLSEPLQHLFVEALLVRVLLYLGGVERQHVLRPVLFRKRRDRAREHVGVCDFNARHRPVFVLIFFGVRRLFARRRLFHRRRLASRVRLSLFGRGHEVSVRRSIVAGMGRRSVFARIDAGVRLRRVFD